MKFGPEWLRNMSNDIGNLSSTSSSTLMGSSGGGGGSGGGSNHLNNINTINNSNSECVASTFFSLVLLSFPIFEYVVTILSFRCIRFTLSAG